MTEPPDDDLLPQPTRFDWWYVVIAAVVTQLAVGLPMWYAVYVGGYNREQLASALVDGVMSLPAGEAFALALVLVMGAGIFGAPLSLWQHQNELARRGDELGLLWRFTTVLCIQFWPLSILTALKHWSVRRQQGGSDV